MHWKVWKVWQPLSFIFLKDSPTLPTLPKQIFIVLFYILFSKKENIQEKGGKGGNLRNNSSLYWKIDSRNSLLFNRMRERKETGGQKDRPHILAICR